MVVQSHMLAFFLSRRSEQHHCWNPAPPPGNAGDELLDEGTAATGRRWDVVVPRVAFWRNQPCNTDWQICDG